MDNSANTKFVEGFNKEKKILLESTLPTKHNKILSQLVCKTENVDLKKLAFKKYDRLKQECDDLTKRKENLTEKETERIQELHKEMNMLKLKQKHFLVLSIEQILSNAENHLFHIGKNNNLIYVFNGEYWKEIDKDEFQSFLGVSSEKLGIPHFDAKLFTFREQLLKQFYATAHITIPEAESNKVLINLQNGTFEITAKSQKIKPFNKKDFLTYQLAFKYDKNAKALLFTQYLNEVLPDISRQKVLAEYMGYVFMKNGNNTIKEEKALVLFGSGANGKSVFFEVISALLGEENTSNYSLERLTDEQGYQRAQIANKLVNYASEINGKLQASVFKQLVSGEPVEARLPYGEPFILKQYAKLIFNCNELPKEVEQTNAFFRRFLIIPFDVTIPPEKQDKQLHHKIIKNELSGVFNWVLEGLERLLEQGGFTPCDAIQKTVDNYKKQSDSVLMFLDEKEYQPHFDSYFLLKDLYIDYRMFCFDDGYKAVKKTNFRTRLEKAKFSVKKINVGNVVYLSNKK